MKDPLASIMSALLVASTAGSAEIPASPAAVPAAFVRSHHHRCQTSIRPPSIQGSFGVRHQNSWNAFIGTRLYQSTDGEHADDIEAPENHFNGPSDASNGQTGTPAKGTNKKKHRKQKMDSILVVDVESTCWERAPPEGQVSEIIEVGLVRLELQSLRILDKTSMFVRPQHSQVSAYCTKLTTIRPEDVAAAATLEEVCQRLQDEFGSGERVWASWGDYDRQQFERNCDLYGIETPFGPSHVNVKILFALARGTKPAGMSKALKHLGFSLEGTHHRGADDAYNIARILASILGATRRGRMEAVQEIE